MKSSLRTALGLLALTLMAFAAHAEDVKLSKIRIGILPIRDTLPIYVGKDQGFFKEQGIDLEIVPIVGGAVAIPAMEGGSLDMTYSDVGSIFKAAQQGLKLRIVSPSGRVATAPEDDAHFLAAKDGSVKSLADVRGKRVAVNLLRNIVHAYVTATLDKAGVAPGSYTVVELPYPQMNDAIINSQVDLAYQVPPFTNIAINSGKVADLGPAIFPIQTDVCIAAYAVSGRWLSANSDLVKRFQRAAQRAAAFVTEQRSKQAEWTTKFLGVKAELSEQMPIISYTWTPAELFKSLDATRNMMLKYKFLDKEIDPREIVLDPGK